MSYSEFHEQQASTEPNQSVLEETPKADGSLPSKRSKPRRRWLVPLGLILLLLGGGLGWRWWQSQAAGGQGGPSAGFQMPPPAVQLKTLETTTVQESSEFVGELESLRSVVLRPEITGRVSEIYVQPGDRVTAGTPLVQISPNKRQAELASVLAAVNSARASRANALSQLQVAQSERAAQQAEVDLQNDEYRRISILVKEGALPQQNLDRVVRDQRQAIAELNATNERIAASRANLVETEAGVQQAQANADLANEELQDTTIVAPFDGIVGDIPIRLGQLATPESTLTTVTQNQSLELRLAIPLERSPELRRGQRVQLVNAEGTVLSTGQISFIAPQVNPNAQSILAKVTFNNAQGRLRDGQFVRARVIWREQPGILVPTTAVTRIAGEPFVFVVQPGSAQPPANAQPGQPPAQGGQPSLVASQRLVKLGSIQGNQYQVLEGVKPGEQVAVTGILNLQDGVPVTPEPAK